MSVHAGDNIKVPNFALEVGDSTTSVTVVENTQIIPVDNGERAAVLDSARHSELALETRNISELLKVLPGVTVMPNATNNSGVGSALLAVSTGQSAVGNNLYFNGVPNRGGVSQLADGVDINDPGCNCNAIATINPDMTQEVTVQTSNFGADVSHGPVIVNTISKSGGADYHGEGYFFARNDALNANDWQSDHQGLPKGDASYYYPGGNVGGPIPFTHKKLLGWFGYEHYLQNQGNANVLHLLHSDAGDVGRKLHRSWGGQLGALSGWFRPDRNELLQQPAGHGSSERRNYWCHARISGRHHTLGLLGSRRRRAGQHLACGKRRSDHHAGRLQLLRAHRQHPQRVHVPRPRGLQLQR